MNNKHFFTGLLIVLLVLTVACNSNSDAGSSSDSTAADNAGSGAEGSNPKGIGKYQNVELTHPLDENMVTAGKTFMM